MDTIEKKVESAQETLGAIREELRRNIVGQHNVLDELLACLVTGGHALIEGVPGLGKTTIIKMLSSILDLSFSRIQCTPDLMPADIIGTDILVPSSRGGNTIEFRKGPLFTNILLVDEINRATPKTQSALLEAMQELTVTVGGTTYPLTPPFLVCATQNPIEMEGTYPLPEAQLDRFFFKIRIDRPNMEEMLEIVERTTGDRNHNPEMVSSSDQLKHLRETIFKLPGTSEIKRYAVRICEETHSRAETQEWSGYVRYGSSPRGAQAMILAGKVFALMDGRLNLSFEDVRRAAVPSLRHRIILSFKGEAEGVGTEQIIQQILRTVPEME